LTQPSEILSEATPSLHGTRNNYEAETSSMVRDDDDVTPELKRRRGESVGSRIIIIIVVVVVAQVWVFCALRPKAAPRNVADIVALHAS